MDRREIDRIRLMSMKQTTVMAAGALLFGSAFIVPANAATAKDGEPVYTAKCKNCHGADGAGNPAIAKMMNVTMKPLGAAEVQAKSDADLKAVITAGTGKMKPVAGISPGDTDNVVAYLRTLKK
jgi:mono/diheme cytochrome c family protein